MKRTMSVIALVCLLATITFGAQAQESVPNPEITAPVVVDTASITEAPPSIPVEIEPETITLEEATPAAELLPADWTAGDYGKLVALKLLPTVVYIVSALLMTLAGIGVYYLKQHTGIVITEKQLSMMQEVASTSWKTVEERLRGGTLKLPEGKKPRGAQKLEAALDIAEGLADEMGLKKMARDQLQKLIEAKLMEGRG